MNELTVRIVGTLLDDGVYTVAMGETRDGAGANLLFSTQATEDFTDQDVHLGMDTYCISNEFGATVYGGVQECVLGRNELSIRLSRQAATDLGLECDIVLRLEISESEFEDLRQGLRIVFANREPTVLVL